MLDALIAQLPGATLDNNGRIMVNGKQIESLLVDGKDFSRATPMWRCAICPPMW